MARHMARHHVCRCGHAAEAHEHYRRGTDCGACGPATCASFTADRHATVAELADRPNQSPATVFPARTVTAVQTPVGS